jgi:hypothetical protein
MRKSRFPFARQAGRLRSWCFHQKKSGTGSSRYSGESRNQVFINTMDSGAPDSDPGFAAVTMAGTFYKFINFNVSLIKRRLEKAGSR